MPSTPWHAKHPAASALALPTSGFPSAAIAATGTVRLSGTMSEAKIRIVIRFSQCLWIETKSPWRLNSPGRGSIRRDDYLRLAIVPDAIDRSGLIIRDQERPIHRADRHISGAAPVLVVLDPTPRERLLRDVLAIRVGLDADNLGPSVHKLVPAAVLGEEDVVPVLSRETVPGVELHAQHPHVRPDVQGRRCELAALVAHGVFRIRNVALVTIGIAEVLTVLDQVVELVGRDVVAHPVARILGEPELAGSRIDVAADAVALAERSHLRQALVRVDVAILRRA